MKIRNSRKIILRITSQHFNSIQSFPIRNYFSQDMHQCKVRPSMKNPIGNMFSDHYTARRFELDRLCQHSSILPITGSKAALGKACRRFSFFHFHVVFDRRIGFCSEIRVGDPLVLEILDLPLLLSCVVTCNVMLYFWTWHYTLFTR